MRISLITVCYNSAKTIRTALESVLRQRGADVEYLVVDGASTDGTIEAIREYEPRFKGRMRWVSEPDHGMYEAINKGIEKATGDVVGILNADDFLETDSTLADVAKAFAEHPNAQALYADIRFIRENKEEITDYRLQEEESTAGAKVEMLRERPTLRYYSARRWRPWMFQWGYMPPHPSVYIRREWFAKLGGYKLDYEIAADYELLIRYLRKAKLQTVYLHECLTGMRTGGKSTRGARSNLLLNQEIVRGNRENGYVCCLPMLLPKYAFKVWEFIAPRLGLRK